MNSTDAPYNKIYAALSVAYVEFSLKQTEYDPEWYRCQIPSRVWYRVGEEKAMPSALEYEGFGLLAAKDGDRICCIVRLKQA